MQRNILWKGLDADTTENCSVNFWDGKATVRSEISGWVNKRPITAEYYIKLDDKWRVLEFDISFQSGNNPERRYAMFSNADCKWSDSLGIYYPEFDKCSYIDITLTPLTNSLPINGLLLREGESRQIDVLYIDVLNAKLSRDRQVYTKTAMQEYRFENDGGNFTAVLTVDNEGFVTNYPELFEMYNYGNQPANN